MTVCQRQDAVDGIEYSIYSGLESIHTLGIFPILLHYNLELTWIFGGVVSFDLHNMPTTLKMQCIFLLWNKQEMRQKKTENMSLSQYFVETPFAAITAACLLGYVSISLAHLATGSSCHYSRQNCSSSVKLNGCRWCTAIFKSHHRFSIGLRSGLWLGHSKTFKCYPLNHSSVALAVC